MFDIILHHFAIQSPVLLYIISFFVLVFAELCGTMHQIYVVKNKKYMVALFDGLSSALWCIKIVVVIDQPLTITTGFIDGYVGVLIAYKLEEKFSNRDRLNLEP